MKKILALFCLIVFSNSAFAFQNYTYTRVEDEHYSASSPTGYFEEHKYPETPGYVKDNFHNVTYVANEPVSSTIQDIRTPQDYNRRKVVTESMRDDREKADKVIERAGVIGFTLGFLGLITMGIIGIARNL